MVSGSLALIFAVLKLQRVAGQQPREGTKSCRMGKNSVHESIRLFVHPYVPPLASPQTSLAAPQTPLAGPMTPLIGPMTPLASPQPL